MRILKRYNAGKSVMYRMKVFEMLMKQNRPCLKKSNANLSSGGKRVVFNDPKCSRYAKQYSLLEDVSGGWMRATLKHILAQFTDISRFFLHTFCNNMIVRLIAPTVAAYTGHGALLRLHRKCKTVLIQSGHVLGNSFRLKQERVKA